MKLATKASLKGVVAVAFVAATIAGVLSQRPSHAAGDPLPEALIRNRTPADAVPAAAASVLERIGFDVSNSRQVEGDVYLVTRHRGLCVVSVIGSELPFGCARPGAFFKGHRLFFTIDEDGRPSAPSRLHVAGVARGDDRAGEFLHSPLGVVQAIRSCCCSAKRRLDQMMKSRRLFPAPLLSVALLLVFTTTHPAAGQRGGAGRGGEPIVLNPDDVSAFADPPAGFNFSQRIFH